MIDWGRLLIRTNRPDTPEMLGCWEWVVGRDMHPLVMTKFGDWFLADPQERVHRLELLGGTSTQVADSIAAFEQLMVREEQLDQWFMLPWCYRLHDEGHVPDDNQCFGFKVPPRLGAPIDLSNVEIANLLAYQVWMSEMARIPPGTVVDAITVARWRYPWQPLAPDHARVPGLERQLGRELAAGHPLFGLPVRALGRQQDRDDVLFAIEDGTGRVAVVHLTWTHNPPEPLPYPWTVLYPSFEAWVADGMRADAAEFGV